MFSRTLDSRKQIQDPNGNILIDLFPSIFDFNVSALENYTVYKVSDYYCMRPDRIALRYMGSTEHTEKILLFNGISNPFTIDKDDILMIPNPAEMDAQFRDLGEDIGDNGLNNSLATKNAYKYISEKKFPKYNANNKFDNSKIGDTSTKQGKSPYIVDNDAPPVTVSNGRIYFGTNTGLLTPNDIPSSNIDAKIEKLVNKALGMINPSTGDGTGGSNGPSDNLCQSLGCGDNSCTTENCLSEGTTLSDILRGTKTIL